MTSAQPTMPAHSDQIERYTPSYIFEGLGVSFDLDPCAAPEFTPSKIYCTQNYVLAWGLDGLALPWRGFVFLNPPWQKGVKRKWISKLADHAEGIAIVRGGTDSKWLHDAQPDGLLLLRNRVDYLLPEGVVAKPRKGGASGPFEPSMLLAFGDIAVAVLANCTLDSMFLVPGRV